MHCPWWRLHWYLRLFYFSFADFLVGKISAGIHPLTFSIYGKQFFNNSVSVTDPVTLQAVDIRCFWWSDAATLRPALSVPPGYDQEIAISGLEISRDLIFGHVTCLVIAIGEAVT